MVDGWLFLLLKKIAKLLLRFRINKSLYNDVYKPYPENSKLNMIPKVMPRPGVSLRAGHWPNWPPVNATLPCCLTSQRTFFNTRNDQKQC